MSPRHACREDVAYLKCRPCLRHKAVKSEELSEGRFTAEGVVQTYLGYGGEYPEKFESRATRGGGARTTCGHGARNLFPPHDLRFAHDLLSLAHDVLP